MTTYTYGQLQTIWLEAAKGTKYATDAWARLMAAIALAESSGNPDSTNPTDNNGTQTSWGLWQISLGNHNEPSPTWNNPITNAQLAIGKLNGQGLSAWGTYDTGAYKQYMQGSGPTDVNLASDTSSSSAASGGGSKLNPLTWVEAPIKGFEQFGSFITGTAGAASTIGDVATAITGLVRAATKFMGFIMLIFRPAFWLRVGAFVVAILLAGGAIYMLSEAL